MIPLAEGTSSSPQSNSQAESQMVAARAREEGQGGGQCAMGREFQCEKMKKILEKGGVAVSQQCKCA